LDAIKYLKVFTLLTKDELETLKAEHEVNPGLRLAQKTLAGEIIKIVHSPKDLERAIAMSAALFSGEVSLLSEDEITELFANMMVEVADGLKLEDILLAVKAAKSKREAREFIAGNSILVNGEKITDSELVMLRTNGLFNKYFIIRRGKKNYFVAKIV
ncbi:MAG TPA: S4 domain-containing protein, partial [Bacilli bacterium]|nr:S4 domain-containing protein [Bacilli bacterium]